jgi:GNAT superfamily N-acetyltransferase
MVPVFTCQEINTLIYCRYLLDRIDNTWYPKSLKKRFPISLSEKESSKVLPDRTSYFTHLRDKVRYSPLPRLFIDGFDKLGIQIHLVYLIREGITEGVARLQQDRVEGYDVAFLGLEDMMEMARIPYRPARYEELKNRLKHGNLCLGAKRDGHLVAFTWCNLTRCETEGYSFPLNDYEAYLFDAYTTHELRGQGLAPALRYRLYEELARKGRTKLYSISDRFNAPALRFKLKLGARILKSDWYVTLFRRWHFGPRGQRPD